MTPELRELARRLAAEAPPLTPQQRADLAAILRPVAIKAPARQTTTRRRAA